MSGAPVRIGAYQLLDPPIIAGIVMKNIIRRTRRLGCHHEVVLSTAERMDVLTP